VTKTTTPREIHDDELFDEVFKSVLELVARRAKKDPCAVQWYLGNILLRLLEATPNYIPCQLWDGYFARLDKTRRRALRKGSRVNFVTYGEPRRKGAA
jgi:hypothetical protein